MRLVRLALGLSLLVRALVPGVTAAVVSLLVRTIASSVAPIREIGTDLNDPPAGGDGAGDLRSKSLADIGDLGANAACTRQFLDWLR